MKTINNEMIIKKKHIRGKRKKTLIDHALGPALNGFWNPRSRRCATGASGVGEPLPESGTPLEGAQSWTGDRVFEENLEAQILRIPFFVFSFFFAIDSVQRFCHRCLRWPCHVIWKHWLVPEEGSGVPSLYAISPVFFLNDSANNYMIFQPSAVKY